VPARQPQRFEYVFVVTYGRSGSTLLQGLLNALPRVVVRGENSLFVLQLYRAWAQASTFRERHKGHRPRKVQSAFYGIRDLRRRQFTVATRHLMTKFLLGSLNRSDVDVIGFKEVLWHEVKPRETEGFFDFMDAAFPGARYILNQRAHDHVATSGFWQRHDSDEVFAALERVEKMQEFLRRTRPERTYDCRYELITHEDPAISSAQLRGLAEFVTGSCDDALLARLHETRAVAFGPKAFQASQRRRESDGEHGQDAPDRV